MSEVAFVGEDVGWHVVFEGSIEDVDADALIATLTARVGMASGESCESIQIISAKVQVGAPTRSVA